MTDVRPFVPGKTELFEGVFGCGWRGCPQEYEAITDVTFWQVEAILINVEVRDTMADGKPFLRANGSDGVARAPAVKPLEEKRSSVERPQVQWDKI
jgi:hypothetical protein